MTKEELLKNYFWELKILEEMGYAKEMVEEFVWGVYSDGYEDGYDDGVADERT